MGFPRELFLFLLFWFQLSNTSAVNVPTTAPISGFGVVNAFPGLAFDHPVVLAAPARDTNRLFIAEKSGRIIIIPDLQHPSAATFLDLSETTYASVEAGLLGLAFHPKFAENGRFFVYRVSQPAGFQDELIEFQCDPHSDSPVDPASGKVLLSQLDASDTHNAGDLKFGPDGYLYLSLGDNGPLPPDTHDAPQAIDKGFFGGIIRIDVDAGPDSLAPNPHPAIVHGYRIPKDNPFIGATTFNGTAVDPLKVRTEFYAVGMRNPWRFTFDPFNGNLIAADVGEGTTEEIDVVRKGGNYGWPFMEGSSVTIPEGLPPGLIGPAYEYSHGLGLFGGRVVIGGLVYAGTELPELSGKYLFADYDSGNLWAIDLSLPNPVPVWLTSRAGISAFGRDPRDGGVLVANHLLGRIERLTFLAAELAPVPKDLRELGAFADLKSLEPSADLVPYDVINPLWSDGAIKQRWIDFTRARGRVRFNATEAYDVPPGTVFLKHFELELTNGVASSRRRIETRALVKTEDGVYGLTYRWGESRTNAFLVPPEGTNETFVINDHGILRTQVWSYPTWDQCQSCHNKEAGFILGFRTHQLNREISVAGSLTNQLAWLAAQGLFADPGEIVPDQLPRLSALDDSIAPALHRVRSYLESNCMHCHRPGGRSGAPWDARISTPIEEAHILGARSIFYPSPMKIIDPGNLTNSYILQRTSTRVPLFQMPPLASSAVDETFVKLLTTWIPQIPGPEWQSADVGSVTADGSMEIDGATFRVSSAAAGVATNSIFFCGKVAFGSTEISARLVSMRSESGGAEAGLMIRQSLDPGAESATLLRKDQLWQFWASTSVYPSFHLISSVPSFLGDRIRLVSDGQNVSAWVAGEVGKWRPIGTVALPLSSGFLVGFGAASAGKASQYVTGQFDDLNISSVSLDVPLETNVTLPAQVAVSAQAATMGIDPVTISFVANSNIVMQVSAPPWSAVWTNLTEGTFTLSAILTGKGSSVTSAPVALQVNAPETQVWLKGPDRRTGGNWVGRYGATAFIIPGLTNKLSSEVTISFLNGVSKVLGPSTNRSALQVDGVGTASLMSSPGPLEILIRSSDYGVKQTELYFRDWMGFGRTQRVTFLDPRKGIVVAQTNINAQPAVYLPFVFRNEVLVRIENLSGDSYLTGLFVDQVPPISVDLTSPAEGTTLLQPALVRLNFSAVAPGRAVTRVEIWDNGALMRSYTNATLEVTLTNLFPGLHEIKAVAYGAFGTSGQSESLVVTILPAPSRADFIGTDDRTQGDWKGRYGREGWWLIGDDAQYPTSVQMTSDGQFYLFADSTAEAGALERPYVEERFAACLFGAPEFSLDLNLRGGESWVAGLYFLDWGDSHRSLDVVVEALDGVELDRQSVTGFSGGRYLFWRVQGHVRFRFLAHAINGVVSAVFLDHDLTPYEIWRNKQFTPGEVRTLGSEFNSADTDGDGFGNALEYFLGYDPKSAIDKPIFRYSLSAGWFQIIFSQRQQPSDITLVVDVSSDLVHWERVRPVTIVQSGGDASRVSFNFPAQGQRQLFVRYTLTSQ